MMKRNKVVFEFDKDWGMIKKGSERVLVRSFARSLQDIRKVGKIQSEEKKPKAVKPKADKVDPGAKSKVNK